MHRSFIKMHGLGNDFVILDSRRGELMPTESQYRALANRKRGIGCDQIIVLAPPVSSGADLFMHMVNADGSLVRACGNATRCVTRLLFEENGKTEGVIETVAGLLKVWKDNDGYGVDFGPPRLEAAAIPLARAMDTLNVDLGPDAPVPACCVNVGNPHAVMFVPDVAAIDLGLVGPRLEHHPVFPDRCNIEFVQVMSRTVLRMRVWERGAGITEACGSGACAIPSK